jgi:hypothetical protein
MKVITEMQRFSLVMQWVGDLIQGDMIESLDYKRNYVHPKLRNEIVNGIPQGSLTLVCARVNQYFGFTVVSHRQGQIVSDPCAIKSLKTDVPMIPEEDRDAPIGCWMMDVDFDERVKQRIACDERGYPHCEARYTSVADWEKQTGKNWYEFLNI